MNPVRLTDSDRRILEALFAGGAMHLYELAVSTDAPAYVVRVGLKKLARARLAEDWITSRGHEWRLTDRGRTYANRERQLELE